MDTCSVRGDTVSQTNVLSFARICVVFCPNKCHVSARIGGSTAPPDPPSRTPMATTDVPNRTDSHRHTQTVSKYKSAFCFGPMKILQRQLRGFAKLKTFQKSTI